MNHAFETAVFLINCLPTPTLSNDSPFHKLFDKQPDFDSFKVFGCACYPTQCIFIGYSSRHKGYKCYNPISKKINVSRHVVFDESIFPYLLTSLGSSNSSNNLSSSSGPQFSSIGPTPNVQA